MNFGLYTKGIAKGSILHVFDAAAENLAAAAAF